MNGLLVDSADRQDVLDRLGNEGVALNPLPTFRGIARTFERRQVTTASTARDTLLSRGVRDTIATLRRETGNNRFTIDPSIRDPRIPEDMRSSPDLVQSLELIRSSEPLIKELQAKGVKLQTADEIEKDAARRADAARIAAEGATGFQEFVGTGLSFAVDPAANAVLVLGAPFAAAEGAGALTVGVTEAVIQSASVAAAGLANLEDPLRKRLGIGQTPTEVAAEAAMAGVFGGTTAAGFTKLLKMVTKSPAVVARKQLQEDLIDKITDVTSAEVKTQSGVAARTEGLRDAEAALREGRAPRTAEIYAKNLSPDVLGGIRGDLEKAALQFAKASAKVDDEMALLRRASKGVSGRTLLHRTVDTLTREGIESSVRLTEDAAELVVRAADNTEQVLSIGKKAKGFDVATKIEDFVSELGTRNGPPVGATTRPGVSGEVFSGLKKAVAERLQSSRRLEQIQALHSRVRNGVLLDRSMKRGIVRPFKVKRDAAEFGRKVFGDTPHEVVKVGRGFGITQAETKIQRAAAQLADETPILADVPAIKTTKAASIEALDKKRLNTQEIFAEAEAAVKRSERDARLGKREIKVEERQMDLVDSADIPEDLEIEVEGPNGEMVKRSLKEHVAELDDEAQITGFLKGCNGV